jgi:hypothetical protein
LGSSPFILLTIMIHSSPACSKKKVPKQPLPVQPILAAGTQPMCEVSNHCVALPGSRKQLG